MDYDIHADDLKIVKKLIKGLRTRVHPDKFPPSKFSDAESERATAAFQSLGQAKDRLRIN